MSVADEVIRRDRDNDVDLFALTRTVWRYKVFVASVSFVFVLLAVAYALRATPFYRAQVTVTVAEELGAGSGGAIANQLSGLASFAGLSLGGNAGAERDARAVLKSRNMVENFVRQNNLAPLMAENGAKPPTLWNAVKRFQENVIDIREDTRQGVIAVSMEWTDGETAAKWANSFVALTNELIRAQAAGESERNIAYLKAQASQTNVVELQRVMYNLIEGETKKLMVANGRSEYAFTVVDPAVAPELRARPRRTVIVLMGLLMGMLIGSIAAISYDSMRHRDSTPQTRVTQ